MCFCVFILCMSASLLALYSSALPALLAASGPPCPDSATAKKLTTTLSIT